MFTMTEMRSRPPDGGPEDDDVRGHPAGEASPWVVTGGLLESLSRPRQGVCPWRFFAPSPAQEEHTAGEDALGQAVRPALWIRNPMHPRPRGKGMTRQIFFPRILSWSGAMIMGE